MFAGTSVPNTESAPGSETDLLPGAVLFIGLIAVD